MSLSETGAGLRLCRLSSWNQLEDDWQFFLDSPGGGGRLAEKDGEVVGSVAFLRYGANFTWLSMMLVDPKQRSEGIGSQLMEAALDALAGESCVRLDATPLGEPMYRRFGFGPECELARAVATVASANFDEPIVCVEPMQPRDFANVFALDRRVFGADRSALLASFHRRAPELAFVARDGAGVLGYCFGRTGYLYQQLGPIVVENAGIARGLASRCLSTQEGKRIAIDAPASAVEWTRWLESTGFRIERRFLRMRRGENLSPGLPDWQFAIAGPEFG
jgi:predicted N-acetyltransferase YhbS